MTPPDESTMTLDLDLLATQCAPHVHSRTLAVAAGPGKGTPSPWRVSVSGSRGAQDLPSKAAATARLEQLEREGSEVRFGVAQVNRRWSVAYGIPAASALEPCDNVALAGRVLQDCFASAREQTGDTQRALRAAVACYRDGRMPGPEASVPPVAEWIVSPVQLQRIASSCAASVHWDTARALVTVESGRNRYAIGVVGGALARQPRTLDEALATVQALEAARVNYSVGLGQINRTNFARLGLTPERAFDPCANLAAMQTILGECYQRARTASGPDAALGQALSCYYSGNFATGYHHGYVQRVVAAARDAAPP